MNDPIFSEVIRLQLSIYATISNGDAPTDAIKLYHSINLEHLLNFARRNFKKLKDNSKHLSSFLLILQDTIYSEMKDDQFGEKYSVKINDFIVELLDECKDDSNYLRIPLLLIYQILQLTSKLTSDHNSTLKFENRANKILIELLLQRSTPIDRTQKANILAVLQLFVQQFKQNNVISQLWQKIVSADSDNSIPLELRAQILAHLFDQFIGHNQDFYCDEQFVKIIQSLLASEHREDRKAAYYLLKKILEVRVKQCGSDEFSVFNIILKDRWIVYITIMENLEENQSHLILPSLEQLSTIEYPNQPTWMKWINILYKRLLSHNNVLVVRYTLEHFLELYAQHNLSLELLTQLLNVFNNTHLYNYEGYFIPTDNIDIFIRKQKANFLPALVDVKWKSVPLHFWLKQLYRNNDIFEVELSSDLLLQLATRIRMLQNPFLRRCCIGLLNLMFKKIVQNMNLEKYIKFITTLHNVSDIMNDDEMNELVCSKMVCYDETNDAEVKFTQRFYEILSISKPLNEGYFNKIFKFLNTVPKEKHGWMRFYIVFDHEVKSEKLMKFCKKHYNLDFDALSEKCTINDIIEELKDKLAITSEEKNIIKSCYDFYALNNVKSLTQISDWDIILDNISIKAAKKLLDVSNSTNELNAIPLDNFITFTERNLKDNDDCYNFLESWRKHIRSIYTTEEYQEYTEKLLLRHSDNFYLTLALVNDDVKLEVFVNGLLIGDVTTGENRVEEVYNQSESKIPIRLLRIREHYMLTTTMCFKQFSAILECLKRKSFEIGRKKTRYFENSTEHRLQMRIASAISFLSLNHGTSLSTSDLLELLNMESNHSNVNIIYEYLIAKFSGFDEILNNIKKISQYTASKQVSWISITHTFCILNRDCINIDEVSLILKKLLPMAMGANFQARLYVQLALYNIIRNYEELRNSNWINISDAIREILGESAIDELMEDIRIKIIGLNVKNKPYLLYDSVMYVTNAPFDEISNTDLKDLEKSKALFSKKICNYAKSVAAGVSNEAQATEKNANHLQRKLNPTNNVLWKHDLRLQHTTKCENELYVIASLIDKLPNLGGIARTCEVLGIGNLVLNTKSCIEKPEFKNLSMTAENGLNILEVKVNALPEFLMQKQLEGFKIVGAEQTANSVSFVGFKFPKKTILLLGHEKEGIPSHLLKFLNYAVEIPQYGMVRSLNVHVTGALFMWEYCKQHIY